MIVYFDTSALVKRYSDEPYSQEVRELIGKAEAIACVALTRVELASAIARKQELSQKLRQRAYRAFLRDWHKGIIRIPVDEFLFSHARRKACQHSLRAYDAIHLAAAIRLRRGLGFPIVLATFDRGLWNAGIEEKFDVWPEIFPADKPRR